MKFIKYAAIIISVLVTTTVIVWCALQTDIPEYSRSTQYGDGVFNNDPAPSPRTTTFFGFLQRYLLEEKIDAEPAQPIPLKFITYQDIVNLADDTPAIYRLGHSSLLLKIAGKIIIIDPMFSQRASPFSFMGSRYVTKQNSFCALRRG